ncbi:MAG: ATP-binding protein [Cellulosilyticaceae bacterium]
MTTQEIQHKLIMKQYDSKRMRSVDIQKRHQQEVYEKVPDIQKIDLSLSQIGVSLVRSMLQSAASSKLSEFKERSQELQTLKKMKLVENGFPPDYLDIHYDCSACQDTGFIGTKRCKCFKQALINLSYNQSNLKHVLSHENFGSFKFDYYSDQPFGDYKISPRRNMEQIYDFCVGYVERFATEKGNLLFQGPTGLGKTFLCNCIAKELLDQSYSVLYLSAQDLFRLFSESRFHREDMPEEAKTILDTLFTVDLLIIDDFGTEASNSFTGPDLFNTINTRFLNQKATIISTNLPLKDWQTLYSERIISRIHGNYTILRVFGDDVRLVKKYMMR